VRDFNSASAGYIFDIAAVKHIGKSDLIIKIDLREKELYAFCNKNLKKFGVILPTHV